MIISFTIGALWTCALFVFCLIIVVGIKTVYYTLKKSLTKKRVIQAPPPPPQKVAPKPRRAVRTIEIDPDLADRIYFKKSS